MTGCEFEEEVIENVIESAMLGCLAGAGGGGLLAISGSFAGKDLLDGLLQRPQCIPIEDLYDATDEKRRVGRRGSAK